MRKFDIVLFNGERHLLGERVISYFDNGYKALNLDRPSQVGRNKAHYSHVFIDFRDFDKCQFVRRTTQEEREEMFLPALYWLGGK